MVVCASVETDLDAAYFDLPAANKKRSGAGDTISDSGAIAQTEYCCRVPSLVSTTLL